MIRALNHVGMSVANLERSIEFYRDVLGMEVVSQKAFEGNQYAAILGLAGASGKMVMLKAADMRIELFEFAYPAAKLADPARPVCDQGITHFCVEVSDVRKTYERLKAAGVPFHCAPIEFFGRTTATYGRDPDGNVFELVEFRR